MEFLSKNLMNTTTSVVVNSNTGTVANVFSRDERFQYSSSGFNNDLANTTIRINFDATTTISRIGLIGLNWKDFTIFFNGVTASTFALTSTGATSSSDFATNSEASMFLKFTAVNVTSVSFDILSTFVANSEKAIGFIYLADTQLVFPRIPSSKDHKPVITPKQRALW